MTKQSSLKDGLSLLDTVFAKAREMTVEAIDDISQDVHALFERNVSLVHLVLKVQPKYEEYVKTGMGEEKAFVRAVLDTFTSAEEMVKKSGTRREKKEKGEKKESRNLFPDVTLGLW